MSETTDAAAGEVYVPVGSATKSVAAHFLSLAGSIGRKVVNSFNDKTDRLGTHGTPPVGTPAYVANYGLSVYDGNARSGTGGWTWIGGRIEASLGPLSDGSSGGTVAITGGSVTVNHGSGYRNIAVILSGNLRNSLANPLVSSAGCRLFVTRNGGELIRCQAPMHADLSSPVSATSVERGEFFRATGTSTFVISVLREGGNGGSVDATDVRLYVIDLGPVD